jgi:hypothetical protein
VQTKAGINQRPFGPRNVAILLGLILLAAYFPILLGGQTLCYRDFGVMAIPTAAYDRAALLSGEFPLWNPYSNCGVPFFAQWGTMVLYPLSLIYVLLPMPWSLNFFCVLHLWIGAMGMYYLARRWVAEGWPAAFAAVAFLSNGITQAALSWPNYTAALALIPWVVLLVEHAWSARTVIARNVVLAIVVTALQLLTGVPELAVLTWIVLAVFWLQRLIALPGERRALLSRAALIVTGAGGLCAVQLLPFLELLQYSQRTPGFAAEKWTLPIWGWANFLLPRFHTFSTPEGTNFQYGQEFLSSTYLGGALLLFAAFSFTTRNPRLLTLIVLSVIAAVLALGSSGFIYPAFVKIFPPLAIARYPVKFLFILSFTIPLLAAYGAQAFLVQPHLRKLAVYILLLICAISILAWVNYRFPFQYDRVGEILANSAFRAGFFLLFALIVFAISSQPALERMPALQFCALVVLAADGFTHLKKQNPTISASYFDPNLWAQTQAIPKPEHGDGRAFITPEAEARLLHSNVADPGQDIFGKRVAQWSHLNLLEHVPKVNGSATLQLRDQAIVQSSLYSGTNNALEAWLDFLDVTVTSSPKSAIEWKARPHPMPFITGGQKPVRRESTGPFPSLDFGREVLLEPWFSDLDGVTSTSVAFSEIEISTHKISFRAQASGPAVAVIPASWHPAWVAEVSKPGTPPVRMPLLKANLAFQAVPIPAGHSQVLIYYRDTRFRLGAMISLATLLLCIVALIRKAKTPLSR